MKKFTKSILTGLCAVVGLSAGAAVCTLPAQVDVETAYAQASYTTKDVAMLGSVAGWYGNGNGELRITLGECDWAGESGQKSFDTTLGLGDLPTLLKNLDFFNHIEVGGKTLAEWGCTSCYDNIYTLNSGEPKYTIVLPIAMGSENMAAATAAGVGGGSRLTIKEGALIPSYGYLTGTSTLVYRAGCDYVTMDSSVAYGIVAYGKTEVESIQYVTGWDSTYNNAYFGVSLKGDDYAGNGTQTERHPDYYSDVYTTNHYSNKITVDGEGGKAESYGLFNLGEKGKGYYSFVWRAMEEESEEIFIPAGTLFPSYAMKNLFDANGNPVYIMYETQSDVTFYKQADGTWQKPMVEKQTDVTSAFVSGSDADNFTVIKLATHDYPDSLDNYGGDFVTTKSVLTNSNFYSHVLIDGVALGSTNEAYLNIWGNKGAIGFRTSNGTLTSEITILAGCQIPSYAMLSTGERVSYVTTKDITFVKNGAGEWVEKSVGFANYVAAAKAEIQAYNAEEGLYREAEATQRAEIVAKALAALDNATTEQAVDNIVTNAKVDINMLKTAAWYEAQERAEELEALRADALAQIKAYRADEIYFEEQIAERNNIFVHADGELIADNNEDEIATTVENIKTMLDKVLTKAQVIESAKAELDAYKAEDGLFLEEQAAERAAIVANAKVAIDNAATQTAVSEAVTTAKAAIDGLTLAVEVYVTEDTAMLARIAGWHGNGNFEIRITLSNADWTEEGQKSYNGELAKLLTKLDFFNHIKLGEKTLAEWGCTACYDNIYWLNDGEPDYNIRIPLAMSKENMDAASAAGIGANTPVTILEGALIPSYGYLSQTGNVVYSAGCDYVSIVSGKAYGIEATAKTEVESVKYVQIHDGSCGYFGISFVGDDYLGDGTQLEINPNYSFDNVFTDKVLVNGEAGKVRYYGLFNLGANGAGYYAFQITVPEEEIVSITIPAGAKFPTRAMTTLFAVNGNPVYIMYEVETEVTLYKTENGYVSYEEAALAEIENYKAGMFREAEEGQRLAIVAEAKEALANASDKAAMEAIVAAAKAEIDLLKTAGQYADEENAALAAAKENAAVELDLYKANEEYYEEQSAQRAAIIEAALATIKDAMDVDSVTAIVAEAKAEIDALVTKTAIVESAKAELDAYKAEDGYFLEEQAAQRAAIVAQAKTAIDNAATQTAVNEAVANAKAAIDKLMAASEVYVTEDVVFLGRVNGWYGNGNFEIRITLSNADWTEEGQKTYDGELAQLLTKLDFFNHIKLGEKTLAEWGCTACYDNIYWLNNGEPDYTIMLPLAMGKDNMDAASAAGIGANMPITILAGALIPSYGYLTKTGNVVYSAALDYVSSTTDKAYGVQSIAKTEVEGLKYVQGHDGTCGYLGVSLVGDDYLGDGTQLEINTNYNFENSFVERILVNGEAGKVAYYGLFNLGEAGVGYYAFQIFVPEEEIVSITIPAGTRFPTRAMTNLFVVNGNPVYTMYEVETEITLYRSENGFEGYIVAALAEVENYKAGMFREAEEGQRLAIVAEAKERLLAATEQAEMEAIVAETKAAIDELKTAGEYADEENASLADKKLQAIVEIEVYKADEAYFEAESAQRAEIIAGAVETIKACTEEADVAACVKQAKAAIDELVTKTSIVDAAKAEVESYKAEVTPADKAAERAGIVESAQATIENATSQEAVSAAVAAAKNDIDRLLTIVDDYTEVDSAFIARIGGWYGNGNFTLKITIGNADWTNEIAGEKTYNGNLTLLLNELDFFNKIMVGGKTLAEWGCTGCYDNNYELNAGEPDYIFLFHLTMSKENMDAATAAGIKADMPVTVLEGALIPSYGYLTIGNPLVYRAGCDYVTSASTVAYGIESLASTQVESVKYVQGFDGTCGYFGISLVGDDYLGDGTQLAVNQNYYYDYKFSDLILVNGETGKVGYYGLFNLGEAGAGYYAFQIFVAEEDLVSITIPAGTRFPTRAMTNLYEINGNPVYIMYEVSKETTLYKTENGFASYADFAAEELAAYKAGKFLEAEEAQRLAIVEQAVADLDGLTDQAAIEAIVTAAKAEIDKLKTAAQYADEELADDKKAAIDEMVGYKADVAYLSEQAAEREAIISAGKDKVAEAVSLEELAQIVTEAKAAIDEIATKASIVEAAKAEVEGYKADLVYLDAQAAEKAAVVTEALAAIESATSQATIDETVANAKAAIDAIKTKAEVEADALQAKKDEANAVVDGLKKAIDFDLYDDEGIAAINSLYAGVKAAITGAETETAVDEAVAQFKAALAEVPEKDNGGSGDVSSDNVTSNPTSENKKEEKKGCSSVTGGLAYGMVALVAVAGLLFKKKED